MYSAELEILIRSQNNNRPGSADERRPQGSPSRHPPAVEQHIRQMDPYRAFLAGQRDKSPGKDKGMTQYLEEWERRWAQMSGGTNNKGSLPFLALL